MKTILVDAADTFTHEVKGTYVINKDMHDLLNTYSNPKLIVTNANQEQQKLFGLTDLPYELFTLSHEPNKDDPAYFKTLMERYNLTPEDIVYFEHNPEAVDSARSLGFKSYFYDHQAANLAELKEFLDKHL